MHSAFNEKVWMWRGQANGHFGISPGMHTRVNNSSFPHSEETAAKATGGLITAARSLGLDHKDGHTLPDLALLANLQHYGAATPLLDVSTDPLIALWMIAFADPTSPSRLDNLAGSLFGILRPPQERWIEPLDARPYEEIAPTLGDEVWWYRAPDVTERLRIQRGSFLVGNLSTVNQAKDSTLPFELALDEENFISNRIDNRGKRGNGYLGKAGGKVEAFRMVVPGPSKPHLRELLEERSGLSIETIYPTPWHQPFIGQFSNTYGRTRKLELDLKTSPPVSP